ncbi:MAG: TetR/AcrR family transcriptional regulator [Clostridia bacterium]|nr:TetR/AcrR family transcriptional regulator [Clostridia bacterium]
MDYRRDEPCTRLAQVKLRQSLYALMREKPVGRITVRELCERSGVNRSTFYSYYADINDLYVKIIKEYYQVYHGYIQQMLSLLCGCGDPACLTKEECRRAARLFLDTVRDNKELFQFIYHDSSPSGLTVSANRLLFTRIMKLLPAELKPVFRRSLRFVGGGTAAVVTAWLEADCDVPVEDLAKSLGYYYYGVFNGKASGK